MKKMTLARKSANNKDSKFHLNWPENMEILPTHTQVILTIFHNSWAKIVDSLLLHCF